MAKVTSSLLQLPVIELRDRIVEEGVVCFVGIEVESVSLGPDRGITWPGELDLCADSLYLDLTGKSLRETPGALGVLLKAGLAVLWNLPYCLKHRQVCRAEDFELPLK